jgi:CheY-like chemotaxis protein
MNKPLLSLEEQLSSWILSDDINNQIKHPVLNDVRLLLVDDNMLSHEYLPVILRRIGMQVDCAKNGAEALELIDKNEYSVVLMDIYMEVMDGYEATRLIRADSRFADLPIIAMTGFTSAEDIASCLAKGMNDHIGKPLNFKLLFQVLSYSVQPQAASRKPRFSRQ